jgi:hypothetical protein
MLATILASLYCAASCGPLGSAQFEPTSDFRIEHAEYGIPDSAGHWANVTEKVASAAQGDMLWLRMVDSAALLGDPAPNVVKTLKVSYFYEGRPRSATIQDFETLAIGDLPGTEDQHGELRILRAEYGALSGPAGVRDVTARLAADVKNDRLRIVADNATMGGDPASGSFKWTRVVYAYKGVVKEVTVPEDWILAIGDVPDPSSPSAPLQILRAVYHPANDTEPHRDVTAFVAAASLGDRLRLIVRPEVFGPTLAPEGANALTVEYSLSGEKHEATVPDDGVLEIGEMPTAPPEALASTPPFGLLILAAAYGPSDGSSPQVNVTPILKAAMAHDGLRLTVGNETMGGDPAGGVEKVLRVCYVLRGRVRTVSVAENQTLLLGTEGAALPLRGFRPLASSGGPLCIIYAEYGDFSRPDLHRDVTDRIASAVVGDSLKMDVAATSVGACPAPCSKNLLRLMYVYHGRLGMLTVGDGDTLQIGAE